MANGLPVFDTTVQDTNLWLKAIQTRLEPSTRQDAYSALRSVLHVLRDRLPVEAVSGLSAQLPMLLRGVFLEGWRPQDPPTDLHSAQDFCDAVGADLPKAFPRDPRSVAQAVLDVVSEHIDPPESHKLRQFLPEPMRTLWPDKLN